MGKIKSALTWLFENPDVLINLEASINLSGQAKLTLSPSRQMLVKDKKHSRIANLISLKYVQELDKHLKKYRNSNSEEKYLKYVDEILEHGVLNPGKDMYSVFPEPINQQIKETFINNIPLPFLSAEGKKSYKIEYNLDTLPFIGITGVNDWPDKVSDERIIKEFKKEVTMECPLLLFEGDGNRIKKVFFERILDKPKYILITSIPGVVIEVISNSTEEKGVFWLHGMFLTYGMINNGNNRTPLFIHVPYAFNTEEVIYNAQHPLILNLLDGTNPKNELCSEALGTLSNSLSNILNQMFNIVPPGRSFDNKVDYSQNINYMLIGILAHYPEIVNEFDEAIQEFWRKAQTLGAISSKEEYPKFTADDLPWFWSHKI